MFLYLNELDITININQVLRCYIRDSKYILAFADGVLEVKKEDYNLFLDSIDIIKKEKMNYNY